MDSTYDRIGVIITFIVEVLVQIYENYLWVWAKSPVALQIGQTKDLSTGQVTRPEEFFNWWLLY